YPIFLHKQKKNSLIEKADTFFLSYFLKIPFYKNKGFTDFKPP
ncbi:MAG: hypothetical protein ACI85Q_001220, partial [Salibacteraceae bacterium]